MRSTDKAWELFGEQDPYFGVASHSKYIGQLSAARKQEFMESGEEFVSDLVEKSETLFGNIEFKNRALDFGCGVGRLVIPFSKRFSEVVGIDVSQSMIAEAIRNCQQSGAGNVTFVQSTDDFVNVHGQFDFVNSYIVLQHIPVKRGMKIIDSLLSRVAPGGHIMLHMSLRRNFPFSKSVKYFAKHRIMGVRQMYNVLRGNRFDRPVMQMNEYDLLSVIEAFSGYGMDSFVVLEDHSAVTTARVMGRRMSAVDSVRP
jgi:2-polyprenyl-3-methyl-5-hydroxy-6-metoxy-1,4-benzoquinol methylase